MMIHRRRAQLCLLLGPSSEPALETYDLNYSRRYCVRAERKRAQRGWPPSKPTDLLPALVYRQVQACLDENVPNT